MHILILNWRDPEHPLAGGAEQALFEHAKYWNKQGVHVTWFSSRFDKSGKTKEIEGIKIQRMGSHYTVTLWAIFTILKHQIPFDIIIDCFHGIPFFTPLFVPKQKIVALIHEVAGKVWFKNVALPIAFIGFFLEKISFHLYKSVTFITVSESTKEELSAHGIKLNYIHIIHNGVNTIPMPQIKKRSNVLIFLGRLSNDKGITDVFNVFNELSSRHSELQLWLIGKEEKKGYIEKILSHHKLRKNITYFGYVEERKKFELLKQSTIMIHPSIKEGWGINVIEAASQATPTVGYNVAGLRDSIINDKTGMLVPRGQKNLVKAVDKLLTDISKRKQMSENAVKWANSFNWKKSASESFLLLQKIYEINK